MKNRKSCIVEQKGNRLILKTSQFTINYNLEHGSWNIASSQNISFRGDELFARVQVDGKWVQTWGNPVKRWEKKDFIDSLGEGTRVKFIYQTGAEPVRLTLIMFIYRERPSILMNLCVRNRSKETLRIGELRPLEMEFARGGSLFLGKGLDSAKIYRESNNVRESVVRNLKDTKIDLQEFGYSPAAAIKTEDPLYGAHQSGWPGLIFNPQSQLSFLGGFVTVQMALGKIVTRYQPDLGITQWYGACKYDGLEIEPGKELISEKFFIDVRSDPFKSLETFADVVVAENNLPPIEGTPALWCSWYQSGLRITEEEILENAQVVAKHFRDYGVKVMQLDYGWNHKDIPGDWSYNKEKFPHGLKWLAKQLESMGLELGLWLAPFTVFEGSEVFQKHPDCVVRDSQGRPSPWQSPWPWEPKQTIYDLDVRKAESQKFLSDVFREFASLGVQYLKLDFLNGPSTAPLSFVEGIRNEDRIRDGERMRIGLSLIRKIMGDRAYLLVVNMPYSHALGIVSAIRAGNDVGASIFDNEESWRQLKILNSGLISRYYQQKRFWHCDPDVLYVGGNPPDFSPIADVGEARVRTTVAALSGGPVVLGDNLVKLPEERLAMYTLCLPAYGISARPVDLFTVNYPRIWDLKVETDWGKWDVIGLFNYEGQPVSIPVDLAELGLRGKKNYLVWEFWEQEFLGIQSQKIEVEVPARNVRVILLKELPKIPTILSTSFHLSQGGVELSQVMWNGRQKVLSGVCHRLPGARGDLIFYVPENFNIAECTVTGNIISAVAVAPGVWKVDLDFRNRAIKWQVRFR